MTVSKALLLLTIVLLSGLAPSTVQAGHWGAGTFDNDSAADFLREMVQGAELSSLRGALDASLNPSQYLDDEVASRALAAAELVAAMTGRPSRDVSAANREWARRHAKAADTILVRLALEAVDKIGKQSETRDLMMESADSNLLKEWQANVADLRSRLVTP